MKMPLVAVALVLAVGSQPARAQTQDSVSFLSRIHGELIGAGCCAPLHVASWTQSRSALGVGGAIRLTVTHAIALRVDGWFVDRNLDLISLSQGSSSATRDALWMSTAGADIGARIWRLDASMTGGFGFISAKSSTVWTDPQFACFDICTASNSTPAGRGGSSSGSGVNGLWSIGGRLAYNRLITGVQYFIPQRVIGEMASPRETALFTVGTRW